MFDRPDQDRPSGTDAGLALEDLVGLLDAVIVLQPEIESVMQACLSDAAKDAILARRGGRLNNALVEILDRSERLGSTPIGDEACRLFRYHQHLLAQTLEYAYSIDAVLHPRAERYFRPGLGEPAVRLRRLRDLVAGYLGADQPPAGSVLPLEAGHALRTPLTTILGNASSLSQSDVAWTADEEQRLLAGIVDQSHRLARAIDNILDLAAIQAGALRPDYDWCNVGGVVRAAVAQVEAAFAQHVEVGIDGDDALVWADHRLLTRALVNLVDNAFRHNAFRHNGAGTQVSVRVRTAADGVVISVLDDGRGLPTKVAKAVASVRRGHALPTEIGTGICTAIGLIRAHGGTAELDSRPGQTRWVVTLPLPAGD
jgi:signal transduction histidine kinase